MDSETKDILQSIRNWLRVLAVSGAVGAAVYVLKERGTIAAVFWPLFRGAAILVPYAIIILLGLIVAYSSAGLVTRKRDGAAKDEKTIARD